MTSAFVSAAELMARVLGLAGYRFAVIEHPISSASADELTAKARVATDEIVALLLEGP